MSQKKTSANSVELPIGSSINCTLDDCIYVREGILYDTKLMELKYLAMEKGLSKPFPQHPLGLLEFLGISA